MTYVVATALLLTFWKPAYYLVMYVISATKKDADWTLWVSHLKEWGTQYWSLVSWKTKTDEV